MFSMLKHVIHALTSRFLAALLFIQQKFTDVSSHSSRLMHFGSCVNKASRAALVLAPPNALVSAAESLKAAVLPVPSAYSVASQ